MSLTYRAVQVTEPGKLELVNRPIPETPAGKVRLRVEACGICHTDGGTVYNAFPGLTLPRVPGHEVVGRIDALGEGVSGWKIGQRVGVGFLGGHCGSASHVVVVISSLAPISQFPVSTTTVAMPKLCLPFPADWLPSRMT
jgi:D-arabinose 1-dehydrogenase-like Zn-dependent alcohol dehydrogenase